MFLTVKLIKLHIQSGLNNKEILHTPQISRTGYSPPDAILFHTQDTVVYCKYKYVTITS